MQMKKLTAMILVALAQPALAEQLEAISVESTFEDKLPPVHISTSTTLQPEATSRERNSTASLGKALSELPGVDSMSTGAQSSKPVVRGDTGYRLPILQEGTQVEYQAYGTRHNPNVEPVLMEKFAVIRGPQGLKYSSQAVKSAVSLAGPQIIYTGKGKTVTRSEMIGEYNTNNREHLLGIKTKYGTHTLGLVAGLVTRLGDDFVTPITSEAKGVKPGDPPGRKPLVTGTTPYTNFESQATTVGIGIQRNWGTVELRHSHWASKQNYLGVEPQPSGYELIPAAGQKLQNEQTQLKLEYFSGDWVIKPAFTHTTNTREAMHEVRYEKMAAYKNDEEYLKLVVNRNDYKLAFEHPAFQGWRGEFGISHFDKEQKLKSGDLTPSATQNGSGVFIVEKRTFKQQNNQPYWETEIGLRYDTQEVKAPLSEENRHFWDEINVYNASNHHRKFSDWSGALGLAYHLTNQWTFTSNIGRSFRAPSIFELYAAGAHGGVQAFQMGNPNLKAETSLNTELAATWQSDKLHTTLSVYSNWVDNYIVLENTEDELYCDHDGDCQATQDSNHPYRKMINQQTRALIQGVEWSAKYKVTSQLTWLATAEVISGRDTKKHRDLPLIPANNASLKGEYTFRDFGKWHKSYLSLGTRYVASKKAAGAYEPFSQFNQTPFGTASTDDYWLWTLQAGGQVKLGKYPLKLDLTVENLFDTAYRDFLDTYKGYAQGMGRNFRLRATMKF